MSWGAMPGTAGNRLASASDDKTVRVWGLSQPEGAPLVRGDRGERTEPGARPPCPYPCLFPAPAAIVELTPEPQRTVCVKVFLRALIPIIAAAHSQWDDFGKQAHKLPDAEWFTDVMPGLLPANLCQCPLATVSGGNNHLDFRLNPA